MKYPSIRIEGAILSADILDKIEQGELLGQKPKDFGFEGSNVKVKDEIVKAWADAQDMWRIYKRKIEDVPESKAGTTETRNFWMVPLLGLLGYDVELYRKAQEISGKTYAISHKAINLDTFPIHVMGFRDSLDKKRQDSGPRMSPHALIQEYINLHEHLYALVSNGLTIRLLRDSSRLIKLSFLEFDLERMFEEEHFADFALMFRLIHYSRMPVKQTEAPESLIEGYHQDSLDSGSRIRDGLSNAVEKSIKSVANGFLSHPENDSLRQAIITDDLSGKAFYQYQLRFIYRLLFLMVIEERDLIFTNDTPRKKKDIYYRYYSVNRIRKLSEKRYLADKKFSDVWMSLKNTFKLFEKEFYGEKLDIKPLAGDLFGSHALGELNNCELNNKVMLECLENLSVFTNPNTQQKMRVNYASLNVEEFGSVYEGLLEYDPVLDVNGSKVEFRLVKGSERSSSGSHYTPDELVQPLIKHSLEYIIEDKLKESDPENALLSITVCDVACGSGHFLLGAARRIATELAKIRTGEDQPSPSAFREAVRDVIRNCIYGVDLNPLAVELAKVALWLEAHNPGEPLNFLDHKIKCGDAIVGLAHLNELEKGIATEAFKKLPGDDDTARTLAKRNKEERKTKQRALDFKAQVGQKIEDVNSAYAHFNKLSETTPAEIEAKQKAYNRLSGGSEWWKLKTLADIQTVQFFIPKTVEHSDQLITDNTYKDMLAGIKTLQGSRAVAKANAVASEKRFFHWFLEFPEVFANGGFDCILGNPPYLGGSKISSNHGDNLFNYLKFMFAPAKGQCDLVGYFLRRDYSILSNKNNLALIATNTIAQGDTREGGLGYICADLKGIIHFAQRNTRWPGRAAVQVTLLSLAKDKSFGRYYLDSRVVSYISPYLDDSKTTFSPPKLSQNSKLSFTGTKVYGEGFILSIETTHSLIEENNKNKNILFPYLNGDDFNKHPMQTPSRYTINFFDWNEDKCKDEYPKCYSIVEETVKPYRNKLKGDKKAKENWWLYQRPRDELYKTIKPLKRTMVCAMASKHVCFAFCPTNIVFMQMLCLFAFDKFFSFSIMSSNLHVEWAWKNSSTLGGSTITYSISDTFNTFPFPQNLSTETEAELDHIGETYHEFRRQLMLKMQLGLTKTYNQFHNPQLSNEIANTEIVRRKELEKKYGKETVYLWNHLNKTVRQAHGDTPGVCILEEAIHDIKHLRQLHKEMDEAVLRAYKWDDLDLAHDFYEVDYLPENDRIRYTISPETRKEVLKRLLLLNHEIYAEEVKQGLHGKKKAQAVTLIKKAVQENTNQMSVFDNPAVKPERLTQKLNPIPASESDNNFKVGDQVVHEQFGQGVVKSVIGYGENAKLTIKFNDYGVKTMMAQYVGLEIG